MGVMTRCKRIYWVNVEPIRYCFGACISPERATGLYTNKEVAERKVKSLTEQYGKDYRFHVVWQWANNDGMREYDATPKWEKYSE